MMRNIGIFGLGGVGGFFGGKLCQVKDGQTHVTFFARGEHLRIIQKHGLTLNTEKEGTLLCQPDLATDSVDAIPALDLCILCVKAFDLIPLLQRIRVRITNDTVLLPLLNGADVYDRIRSVIDTGIVLPACVYVGTHIEKPGTVSQRGGACKILFGRDPKRLDDEPDAVREVLERAGILHELRDDVQTSIWEKFIFISSFGTVTAAHGKTIGEVLDDAQLSSEVAAVIGEAVMIANRIGIELPSDAASAALAKGSTFPHETKTSFQRDFENPAKPDERDLFAGAILNYGRKLGIDTPATRALFEKLETLKPSEGPRRG